jgi:serine/threonine protein kinase
VATLASALAYLHARRVAHRDLKPENILLALPEGGADGAAAVKLGDLGFAKAVPPGGGLLTSCGTPSYVAPEILKGEPYDCACDMWSLGVILYILLCGYAPFASQNQAELFRAIVAGRVAFDSPAWDGVSPDARALVRRLLTTDPRRRATAADVLAAPWLHGAVPSGELAAARDAMRDFNAARRRVVRAGELTKRGAVVRSWKRRTFVLTPESLSYYAGGDWGGGAGGAAAAARLRAGMR